MTSVDTLFTTYKVQNWLATTDRPAILHIFDRACNLINERGQVLSIVTSEVGPGPFNLVVEDTLTFTTYVNSDSPITIDSSAIHIGNKSVQTQNAEVWDAHSDWKEYHTGRKAFLQQASRLSSIKSQVPSLEFSTSLSSSLALADLPSSITAARKLAGLGPGLTPSGDDYMMGALYAVWILHPQEVAAHIVREVANAAAPRTTSLSGGWLRAAADGEAGITWHTFLEALNGGEPSSIELQIANILSIGATSGADALAGFIDTFIAYMETEKKHVLSRLIP